jgi:hypothetical protein
MSCDVSCGHFCSTLSLQRYLTECLAQPPSSMREIGTVIALLQVSHELQDLIRLQDFERPHHV